MPMMAWTISGQIQCGIAKDKIADDECDRSRAELSEDRKSKGRTLAGAKQAWFHQIFKSFNVFLKFTAQEFAALRVKSLNVRDEHQQRTEQQNDGVKSDEGHLVLLATRLAVAGLWRVVAAFVVLLAVDIARGNLPLECVRSMSEAGSLS